jgi:hypothetical protein
MRSLCLIFVSVSLLVACGPEIGDECTDSLDCAIDGTQFCDFTQPEGYCLIVGCRADECPEEAVCVQFGRDERARTFCLRHCNDNGDCRSGYVCTTPDPDLDAEISSEIIDEAPNGDQYCIERPHAE